MGMVTDPPVDDEDSNGADLAAEREVLDQLETIFEALVPLLLRHIQVDRQRTAGSIDGLVARDFRVLDDGEPF